MKRTVGEHARLRASIVGSGREFRGAPYEGARGPVLAPSEMTSAARIAELGGLLALGFRRLALSSRNQLAEWPSTERSCDSVDRRNKSSREEVA